MCKTPKMPPIPAMPPPRAVAKDPDGGYSGMDKRYRDKFRHGTKTLLTSGLGVLEDAQTQLKTLLG